jgi:hypothetical protein
MIFLVLAKDFTAAQLQTVMPLQLQWLKAYFLVFVSKILNG